MSNKSALVFGCLLFSFSWAARLEAQTQNAAISGTVTDSTGAVLAKARVRPGQSLLAPAFRVDAALLVTQGESAATNYH